MPKMKATPTNTSGLFPSRMNAPVKPPLKGLGATRFQLRQARTDTKGNIKRGSK